MAASASPKVTVLMTLFNKGPFVEEAARSVLASTLTDLELLVVDDASTDDGPQVVQALGDPRVRFLPSERNTGRPAAANRGLAAARGTYIAIMDADDIAMPDRFAKQAAFLDAHPGIGACGSAVQAFGADRSLTHLPEDDAGARVRMLFSVPMAYPALMMRRALVEEHHLRCDEGWLRPGMDQLFLVSLTHRTHIANLPDVLIHYRTGEQNMRHGRDPVEDIIHIDRRVFAMVGLPITDEQLALNVHLHKPFADRLDAARVRALWQWVQDLQAINRRLGVLPEAALRQELLTRWDRIFFPLADRDARAALAHLRLSPATSGRMPYLVRTALRRTLAGRKA